MSRQYQYLYVLIYYLHKNSAILAPPPPLTLIRWSRFTFPLLWKITKWTLPSRIKFHSPLCVNSSRKQAAYLSILLMIVYLKPKSMWHLFTQCFRWCCCFFLYFKSENVHFLWLSPLMCSIRLKCFKNRPRVTLIPGTSTQYPSARTTKHSWQFRTISTLGGWGINNITRTTTCYLIDRGRFIGSKTELVIINSTYM